MSWSRFNPRAREGRDPRVAVDERGLVVFQPTRPRGARHGVYKRLSTCKVFQPTRPRGARRMATTNGPVTLEFQPTRPRGARRMR